MSQVLRYAGVDAAIAGTGRNPAGVTPLGFTPSDPPTAAQLQAVMDKVNELIAALQR